MTRYFISCFRDGGDLVSVADAREQAFVHHIISKNIIKFAWLGMKRITYQFNVRLL